MQLTNSTNHTWTGEIPVQPSGTYVYYYIWAKANSGKEQLRPMPAPAGYWKFRVYNPTAVKELNQDNFICTASYQSEQLTLNLFSSTEIDANISLINNLGQPVKILYKGKPTMFILLKVCIL